MTYTIGFAHPAYQFAALLAERAPHLRCLHFASREELAAGIGEVDALAQSSVFWDNGLLERAGKLRFIQSMSVGINHYDLDLLRARGIRLANAQGCVDIAVAEHAIGLMLALTRKLHLARDNQARRHFRPMERDVNARETELYGKTLLVIGFGPIGQRLAGLARAFGMQVLAVRAQPQLGGPADEVHGQPALPVLLPRANFVVLACPLTPQTEGMIDAAALAQMKPSAVLVNVARGRVVDEPALVAALAARQIAAAALDCFWQEPLPAASPLWGFENVIITPHSAGETNRYEERLADIMLDNVSRILRGERELRNGIV